MSYHEQQTVPAPGGPGRPEQSPWVRAGIVGLAAIVVGVLIAGSIWLSQKDDGDSERAATDPASDTGDTGDTASQGSWQPSVVESDGIPTSLDFAGTSEPTGQLEVEVLSQGDGDVVAQGDTITVNYLGQMRDQAEPFDENYSGGTPFQTAVGMGYVIPGWDQGLIGVPAGSRVLLQIPPDLGYGETGAGPIPPNSTLYFVVDVVAVS